MVNLFDKFEIINNIKKLDFRAKKSFGQNFLIDNNICSKIASSIPEKFNDTVIEIGSGFGNLTYILAKKFKQVLSIELDNKLYSFISTEMSDFKNIKFINQDALKININNIIFSNFQNFSNVILCANLPYCITTPVLTKFLKSDLIDYITVMVQKEAAERIVAPLGTRNCGAISYFARYYSNPKINFHVSKNCFFPAPKVDSAVISFDKIKKPNCKNEELLFKIIKLAFEKRRKNILNSIFPNFNFKKEFIYEILKKCNLDTNMRAENLKLEDFINISNLIDSNF